MKWALDGREGIGYSDYGATIRSVAPVLDAAAQEIVDGTVEVVEWDPNPPTIAWRYEPDAVFDVTLNEAACSLAPRGADVAPGDIIALMIEAPEESGGYFALGLLPEGDLSSVEVMENAAVIPIAFVPTSIPLEFRVALPGEPFGAAIIACWLGDVDPLSADPVATEPITITSE